MDISQLVDRILQEKEAKPKKTYTLEPGRGQTYSHGRPVLYSHGVYGRSSVLRGQPQRTWLDQWETWEEARAALAEVKKQIKGFRFEDYGDKGGTSHIDVDVLTRHLPDDADY